MGLLVDGRGPLLRLVWFGAPVASATWPVFAALAILSPGDLGLSLTVASGVAWVLSNPRRDLLGLAIPGLLLSGIAVSRVVAVPMILFAAPVAIGQFFWAGRSRVCCPAVVALLSGGLTVATVVGCWLWVRAQQSAFVFVSVPSWIGSATGSRLALIVVGLSMVNAIAEEVIWRRAIPTTVGDRAGSSVAVVVSAASFGLMHWRALPFGVPGVLMTTAFGLAADRANRRAGSIVPGVAAHFAADMVLLTWLLR